MSTANVIVAKSKIHGLGVFATRDFAEAEIIFQIDDSRIVDDSHPLRPEAGEHSYHCDYLAGGKTVLMRFPERHINSSCDPNSYVKTINGIRHVVARKPIKSGEEITCDYIIDCHGGIVWKRDTVVRLRWSAILKKDALVPGRNRQCAIGSLSTGRF